VARARATQRACCRVRDRRHWRGDQAPPVSWTRSVAPRSARWQSSGRSGRRWSRGSR
jgi:hypothetical protein